MIPAALRDKLSNYLGPAYEETIIAKPLNPKSAVEMAHRLDEAKEFLYPGLQKHGLAGIKKNLRHFVRDRELELETSEPETVQRALGDSVAAFWMKHYAKPHEKAQYIVGKAMMFMEDNPALTLEAASVLVGAELLNYWHGRWGGKHGRAERDAIKEEVEELAKLDPKEQALRVVRQETEATHLHAMQTMFVALAAKGDCSLTGRAGQPATFSGLYDDDLRQRTLAHPQNLLAHLSLLFPDEQKHTLERLAPVHVQCDGVDADADWGNPDELQKLLHAAIHRRK